MGEMTGGIKGGIELAKILYIKAFPAIQGRDERCLDKTFQKRIYNVAGVTSKQAKNVPSKGTTHSHRGDTPFPPWERFIPTLGMCSIVLSHLKCDSN